MNSYEKKFKEELANCIRVIKSRNSDLSEIDTLNHEYRNKINSMTDTLKIIEDENVKEAITKSIDEYSTKIKNNIARKEQLGSWQRESQIKLSALRNICPHTDSKLLYTHPHNNDDVYECTLCGASF